MALKFLYITTDPFVNNSTEFVRILAIWYYPSPPSYSGFAFSGELLDPTGTTAAIFSSVNTTISTEATAYPFAIANSFHGPQIIIIPPGWTFRNFGHALAIQGTLEEVLMVH